MLKNARILILFLLSLAFGITDAEAGRRGVQYSKERPLIYEDSWNLWPYVFINQEGNPDGLNIDVLREIFTRLEIPYEIRLRPSLEAREDLRNDRADLSIGMRKDYNAPFGQFGSTTISVFTHSILAPKRDSLTHVTQEELYHLRFAVHEGSLSHHYLSHHGYDYAMQPVEDMEQLAMDMATADSGIVVWNTMSLKYLMRKYHLDNFLLSPIDIPEGEYRFMSNDERLLQSLDSVLTVMHDNGQLDAIISKWLYPEQIKEEMPLEWRVAIYSIIFLIFIIVVSCVAFYLRQRKSQRMLTDIVRQLNLVLHSNSIKVWIYNPTTRKYSWMNKKGETGREYSSFEFSLFYPKDEFEKINDRVTSFLSQENDSLIMQIRAYSLKDINKVLDIELRMGSIKDDYRHVIYIVGIQHDISEYKSKVERRREMTYYGQSLFRYHLFCLYKFDASGHLTDANDQAIQMLGAKDINEVLDKAITLQSLSLFSESDLKNTEKTRLRLTVDFSDPNNHFPLINPAVDIQRHQYHVLANLTPIVSDEGNVSRYILTIEDVTDQAEREQDVEKKRTEYEKLRKETELVMQHLDYTFRIGGTRRMQYDIEKRILSTSRVNKSETLGMTQIDVLDLADRESLPELFRIFRIMDAKDDEDINAVYRTRTHYCQEDYRTLYMQLRPMYDAEGKVKTYTGIITDITDIVKTKKTLEEETARARETDHLKQNFINNMSYRVRTPLMSISQNIEKIAQSNDNTTEREELDKVASNVTRLLSLLDDTLLLSRLDAGLSEIYRSQCDFNVIFSEAFYDGIGKYRRDNVEYVVEKDSASHILSLDANLIRRVITETVTFFARHTSSGIIRARYMYRRDSIMIMIESTEYVMDEVLLSGIFLPRINDDMLASADSSSGLELAIVHAIIDLLKGRIDVESKIGIGSSFLIMIPVEA